MSLLPWQTAVIRSIVQQTENTRSFFLEASGAAAFDFIPGQFVTLDLPIHERVSKRSRSYSIASPPDGTNHFELIISLMRGGAGTTFLFNEEHIGDTVQYRGPQGSFILPQVLERDICMICTGTGVAPFRSQLHYLFRHNKNLPQIHLVFGTRHRGDILYFEEMRSLAEKHPEFHYDVCLSREHVDEEGFHEGYVHPVYEKICAQGARDMDFYLCGWRAMISEARERLMQMGYGEDRIHFELYG